MSMSIVSSDLYYRGPRGYSNYEIAVQNGYVGTEEEWLEEQKQGAFKYYKKDFDAEYDKQLKKAESAIDDLIAKATEKSSDIEPYAEIVQARGNFKLLNDRLNDIDNNIKNEEKNSKNIADEIKIARASYNSLDERLNAIDFTNGGSINGNIQLNEKVFGSNNDNISDYDRL